MSETQRFCRLCEPLNGNCRICRGKGQIEVRNDISRFRYELISKKCPACEGTGKCYLCRDRKSVHTHTDASSSGEHDTLLERLQRLLTDDYWPGHLRTLKESSREALEIMGAAKDRREAAHQLNRLSLAQLWVLGFLGGARATQGWFLDDFLGRIRRLRVPFPVVQEAILSLEELGLLQRHVRWDSRGHYVIIAVSPDSHIRFLCNFLADVEINLNEPVKPVERFTLDDKQAGNSEDALW